MTKITIFSGFLGAGKTTLIKKLIGEAYKGEKLVLIENEFGEIGIDSGFLKDAGIEITEMNSGCICCSLVGDFTVALQKVLDEYHPDRILIEPSGVGKLSDVIGAVQKLNADVQLAGFVTLADAGKCKIYRKNFGEFYNNQIEYASAIIFSRTDKISDEKLAADIALLRELNQTAPIVTTPWDKLTGGQLLDAIEQKNSLAAALQLLVAEDMHEHHHKQGADCECHDHEHHHKHGADCECHGHHHADEVFMSVGIETARKFTKEKIEACLAALDTDKYGAVLRAKGILPAEDGTWLHFDYVPEEHNIRAGNADYTGRLCVIGSKLDEAAVRHLFDTV